MKTLKRAVALFTVALVTSVFATATVVNAEEQEKTAVIKTTEVKTSTTPNNLLNRRGYYDRFTDTWVYFVKSK